MWSQFLEHALVACRSGWRGQSFRAVMGLGAVLLAGAYLAASFSGRQPATVALDVGLSGIRLVVTLMGLFWVQDLVAKDVDRKNLLWVLAFPAPRATYLLGRFFGIVVLSSAAVAVLGALLWLLVTRVGFGYVQANQVHMGWPYVLTLALLLLDAWVVVALALCVAVLSTNALMPLAVGAGFAVATRSLGGVIAYLLSPDNQVSPALRELVLKSQWVVPDLSRLDIRDVCLYGIALRPEVLAQSIAMALAYMVVLLALAHWVLAQREIV